MQLKQERNLKREQTRIATGIGRERSSKFQESLLQNPAQATIKKKHSDSPIGERVMDATGNQLKHGAADLFNALTKPEPVDESLNHELLKQLKLKRKRKKGHHL